MGILRSWAFNRPPCSPSCGIINASHYKEALQLVYLAYGHCSGTTVSCVTVNTGQGSNGEVITKTFDEDGEVSK